MPDDIDWLTIEDIYEYLGRRVPLDSIRQWIRDGRLVAYKPGKFWLVKKEDLERYLRESRSRPDEGIN